MPTSSAELDAAMDRFLSEQGFTAEPAFGAAMDRPTSDQADPAFGVRTVKRGFQDLPSGMEAEANPVSAHIRDHTASAIAGADRRGLAGAMRDLRTKQQNEHNAARRSASATPAPATPAPATPAPAGRAGAPGPEVAAGSRDWHDARGARRQFNPDAPQE